MKIIFLNVLNAELRDPLAGFVREHAADTDVFCFQEAYDAARALFAEILTDHRLVGTAFKSMAGEDFAQATYVRRDLETGEPEAVLEGDSGRSGLGLCAPVRTAVGFIDVINVHGLAQPGDKLDDPGRLRQSRGLIEFCGSRPGPKIIGGDFNLMPETESVRMFAESGYRDLIKDFRVTTTRNKVAWSKYPGHEQYFSDYLFVSPEVQIRSFVVPNLEVSDHLPLIVDIEI